VNLASLIDLPSMIAPDSIVAIDTTTDGEDRAITYEELRAAVSQTSGLLMELGISSGDRVGLFATNSAAFLHHPSWL
jgi:long-subunit acyl-CoA synthetase (AMP-forming)